MKNYEETLKILMKLFGEEIEVGMSYEHMHKVIHDNLDNLKELINKETPIKHRMQHTNYIYITEKVKLHGIFQRTCVVEPSILMGGHKGGQSSYPVAVIEFKDGTFKEVKPEYLKGDY